MSQPYTYLIGWSKLDKWYYGSRTAKDCHPEELWKTYFTSSKYVKKFRVEYGEPDIIEIRKLFQDKKTCVIWENKVLTKMNVVNSEKWINKSTGYLFDPETTRAANIGNKHRVGKKLSPEHIEAIRKANLGNTHTKGRPNHITEETKAKISAALKGKPKPDGIKQILQARMREFNKTPWNKGMKNGCRTVTQ